MSRHMRQTGNQSEEYSSYKRQNSDAYESQYQNDWKRPNQAWEKDDSSRFGQWKKKGRWDAELYETEFQDVPSPQRPRKYTISIALPSSILEETCKKDELRTYVVGQIARAANIFSVDEIVVFDDQCKQNYGWAGNSSRNFTEMMQMLLEYLECPQYLKKHLFPTHQYLRHAGVLNVLNSPHHLLSTQWCEYREGVVMEKGSSTTSYVDVGLRTNILIYEKLDPWLRVTVKLPPEAREMKKPYGTVVSPDEPREKCGFYWGYTVRVANSFSEAITGTRFPDGYDLLIGTSDKGDDIKTTEFPTFTHALIVFGGVEGLEAAVEADEELEAKEPRQLFDHYINTCPLQQSRTIRTEEAVLISLTSLQDKLIPKGMK